MAQSVPEDGRRRSAPDPFAVAAAAFVVVGAFGLFQYIDGFWLFRGFAAPSQPHYVTVTSGGVSQRVAVRKGTVETITLRAPSLGGRKVSVVVYLPPGYQANPGARYPVLYLLHGTPGEPIQFVNIGDVATDSNTLLAEGRIRPMILVMPQGSTGFFSDDEWANTVRPDNAWETYVAQDVVGTIDSRFRAIDSGAARGIAGLSEGGYAAANISLHHLGEFNLVESWSGYFVADKAPRLFGRLPKLLSYNSPSIFVRTVANAPQLRAMYFWLYAGRSDSELGGTARFVTELAMLHLHVGFAVGVGQHNWKLWRSMMPKSLTVASTYFAQHAG